MATNTVPVVPKVQTKRKSAQQKQKGVVTPEVATKKESKVLPVQGLLDQDDTMNSTPVGKQRKKEEEAVEREADEELRVVDRVHESDEAGEAAPTATSPVAVEEAKVAKEQQGPKEQAAQDKKCCKCTQGNCLNCQCYKNKKWCAPTCKAAACANRATSAKAESGDDAYVARMKAATQEEIAKEMLELSKRLAALSEQEIDTKHMGTAVIQLRKTVLDLQASTGMLSSQITALEKKVVWLQGAKKGEVTKSDGSSSDGRSKARDCLGADMEFLGDGGSGLDFKQGQGSFDMGSFGTELPGEDPWETNRRTEAKAMVIKYFRTQPTAAAIRTVLRKLECEQIEPVAIRTKRVGRDFIALVRFNTAEEVQTIMRNRLMLRGTSLWIDTDKFEKDWERKAESEPKPLSSYPHTELWKDVFQDRPRNRGNGMGNGRRRGRGRGSGKRESWQEVSL